MNSFYLNIFQKSCSKSANIVISPLSIYQILSLTENGAEGDTASQMLQVLGANDNATLNKDNTILYNKISKFATVDMANSVMTKEEILNEFKEVSKLYGADIEKLVSTDQVNSWCSKKTKGKITKIIDSIDGIRMILLNAVYFKGEWQITFKKENTKKLPFYSTKQNSKEVDMMKNTAKFLYYEDNEIQAIQLKYKEDEMFAFIILPKENNSIENYVPSLTSEKIGAILGKLKLEKVNLTLPKFKIEYKNELSGILKELGMKDAFGGNANFSKLSKKELYIDKVIHKTYINVDEEGTTAAAVTAVCMKAKSCMHTKPEIVYNMNINRPFLFSLRSLDLPKGNDFLFMARISEI